MATKAMDTNDDRANERIESKVRMDRPLPWKKLDDSYSDGSVMFQVLVGVVFWALFFVQLGLLIDVYTSANTHGSLEFRTINCTATDTYTYLGNELDSSLKEDLCACEAQRSRRSRHLSSTQNHFTMFELMEEYVYIPITGSMVVAVLGGIWLELLKRLGTTFVWISLIAVLAIKITMASLLFKYEATGAGVVVILFAAAFGAYMAFRREMITRAGKTLETAAQALGKNPCIFGALLPVEALYVGYIFLWIEGWTHAVRAKEIKYDAEDDTCDIEMSAGPYGYMWLISFLLLWISFYINHVKVNVVASSIAAWTFGQSKSFNFSMPLKALRWSFFESSPTLSLTSLICTIIERIKSTIQNKCNWANPFCCCIMLIGMVIAQMLQAFGRFTVVLHAITAKPFYESAYHSGRLLLKGGNLEHALSADFFIAFSLKLFAYVLSIGIGMSMWAWIDDESDLDSMHPEGSWQGWFWFFFILFVIINRYPYVSIFVVSLLGNWQWLADETDGKSSAVLLAIFTGAVAHLIFAFFADIVLDAVDTMVMCYAIDKENGLDTADYASKKEDVVATMYLTLDDLVKREKSEKGEDSLVAAPSSTVTVAEAAAVAMPVSQQKIRVTVPSGVKAGEVIQARAPDGTLVQITVPAGVGPGQILEADVPTV